MKRNRYDIFISYRHDGGKQYARTLQLMLEKKGYRVFLDYNELRDGKFSPLIAQAIKEAPIYMILLSPGALNRCVNDGDWVRKEIEIAIGENKRIIPVNPDNIFDGIPNNIPEQIKEAIGGTQFSEINFGQTLNATVDLMIKHRIKPYVQRQNKTLLYIGCAVLIIGGALGWYCKHKHDEKIINSLKEQITFFGESISWSSDISKEQLLAIQEIFGSIEPIEGGIFYQGALPCFDGNYDYTVEPEFETPAFQVEVASFYMGKYEVSIGQWNAIMHDNRTGDPKAPIASVNFEEATRFTQKLGDLTLIDFRLPTESEWEYAAKGGNTPEGYIFAGSNEADAVAWYAANSEGVSHSELRLEPTSNNLFNMSGNVSEWCDTPFQPYDKNIPYANNNTMVIRGGDYTSQPYELTVTHREPAAPHTSIPTLGFRLAIDKPSK